MGLLVGLLALWLNITFGWEVISPILAPTEIFQYPPRNLDIRYPTAIEDSAGFAVPQATDDAGRRRRGARRRRIDRTGRNRIITRSERAGIARAHNLGRRPTGATGRPGQDGRVKTLGLSFPTPGSEESLILPDQGIGVRIIRRPVSAGRERRKMTKSIASRSTRPIRRRPPRRLPLDAMKPADASKWPTVT